MDGVRVLVVTPTYNESESIRTHLEEVLDGNDRHMLIVDDGSPDGTADQAHRWGAEHALGRVHLLRRHGKQGLGTAYTAGFAWALKSDQFDVVVQMDADGSHPAAVIPALAHAASEHGLAIGSRYVPGGATVGWPLRRRLLSKGANAYARTLLHSPVRDLTGGFKAWTVQTLRGLDLDAVSATGYVFQVEMTLAAQAAGVSPVEVPITFKDRVAGTSKMGMRIALEGLSAVWRLSRRTRTGGAA